ncbi:MAG: hypothetical protein WCI18_07830 [Pseudomonadota bacterium]
MKSMKIIAMASFLGLLETACGGRSAPQMPSTNGNKSTSDLTSGYSSCTAKSCPRVKSYQISNKQVTKGVNEEFGNMSFEASVTDNDSNRKVKLFVDASNMVPGLKATPTNSGFTLSGKIGVPSTYSIRVFVRDLDLCKQQSKSNASSCESSDKSNTNYDIPDSISIVITSGGNQQDISSLGSLPSSCPKTSTPSNALPAVLGGVGVLGSVIDGTSTTGSVITGVASVLAQTFGPKPQQPQVPVTSCR